MNLRLLSQADRDGIQLEVQEYLQNENREKNARWTRKEIDDLKKSVLRLEVRLNEILSILKKK